MKDRTLAIIVTGMLVSYGGYLVWLYPHLPVIMPSHWNVTGQIDGYAPRSSMVAYSFILIVAAMASTALTVRFMRSSAPPASTEANNAATLLVGALLVYLSAVFMATSAFRVIPANQLYWTGYFVSFALLGKLMEKIPPNAVIGYRMRSTLSDAAVWNDTHKLATKVYLRTCIAGLLITWVWNAFLVESCLLIIAFTLPIVYAQSRYNELQG